MNKQILIALAATLTLGAVHAQSKHPSDNAGWVAHADSVFAAADAENMARVTEIAARNAWVAHAEAVFAAADAQNLALAQAVNERTAWVAHAEAVFVAADEMNLMRLASAR